MTSLVALDRLLRVVAAARAADEMRLAAVLTEIEAARRRVRRLKAQIAGAVPGRSDPSAADMAAAARWCQRLSLDARAEEAALADLTARAQPLRAGLSRAIGRETAAGKLAVGARREARRNAERRAEEAAPPRTDQPPLSDPSSSGSAPSGEDSPGIA